MDSPLTHRSSASSRRFPLPPARSARGFQRPSTETMSDEEWFNEFLAELKGMKDRLAAAMPTMSAKDIEVRAYDLAVRRMEQMQPRVTRVRG